MKISSDLKDFIPGEDISHAEIASVNFDQWILTIAIRLYGKKPEQNVEGMVHVIFENPIGFRLLDEGDMLNFPWKDLTKSRSFVHRIDEGGWYDLENKAGNLIHNDKTQEFVIVTGNECVSVITWADNEPICVPAC